MNGVLLNMAVFIRGCALGMIYAYRSEREFAYRMRQLREAGVIHL